MKTQNAIQFHFFAEIKKKTKQNCHEMLIFVL